MYIVIHLFSQPSHFVDCAAIITSDRSLIFLEDLPLVPGDRLDGENELFH
jgi:hypothetical protein